MLLLNANIYHTEWSVILIMLHKITEMPFAEILWDKLCSFKKKFFLDLLFIALCITL